MMLPGAPPLALFAHRGSSGSAPENTLAAFRRAAREGADLIELDVRLSADGHLMVYHDRRLGRTAPGREHIRQKTCHWLQGLDAGSWFAPRFRHEHIPTLQEVMHALPASVGLNIEVKTDGDRRSGWEAACLAAIRGDKPGRRIIVSSFDHQFLKRLHALDPSIPTGALCMPVRDAVRRPSGMARRLGTSAVICSRSQLRRRFVRNAHRHGIEVFVYGVNTARHLDRARRFGVDGVMTDFPARLRKLLRRPAGKRPRSRTTRQA